MAILLTKQETEVLEYIRFCTEKRLKKDNNSTLKEKIIRILNYILHPNEN